MNYIGLQKTNFNSVSPITQVLNLFLALLLSSFGASNLSNAGATDEDTNKLSEAFERIRKFKKWVSGIAIKSFEYMQENVVQCFRNQMTSRRGKYKKREKCILYIV